LTAHDNLELYRLLGGVFGREMQAATLCADFARAWTALDEFSASLPRQRVLYLIWMDPWMTVSRVTYISAMLAAAGRPGTDANPHAYLIMVGDAAQRQGLALAERLRDQLPTLRLRMHCGGGGFKAQFRRADHSGARFALILGEDEVRAGVVALKPLRDPDGQQLTLSHDQAAACLREAVARDAGHSAAWKLLGKALAEGGHESEALAAYEQGIAVARSRGDIQAAREMIVFARRLRRQLPTAES